MINEIEGTERDEIGIVSRNSLCQPNLWRASESVSISRCVRGLDAVPCDVNSPRSASLVGFRAREVFVFSRRPEVGLISVCLSRQRRISLAPLPLF